MKTKDPKHKIRIWWLLVVCSLLVFQGAQADTPPTSQTDTHFLGWSVLLPALVIHGVTPEGDVASRMRRKLDRQARFVLTPGIAIEYRAANSLDLLGAVLKDCYDQPAGTFQAGQHWRVGSRFDWGYTVGVYVRKTPIICYGADPASATGSASGNSTCQFSGDMPIKKTMKLFGTYMDIVPAPFLNASYSLIRSRINVDAKIMANFYLNEIGFEISY